MAIGDEDQRRITMPIAAAAGGADELFDLGRREILARADSAVWPPGAAFNSDIVTIIRRGRFSGDECGGGSLALAGNFLRPSF